MLPQIVFLGLSPWCIPRSGGMWRHSCRVAYHRDNAMYCRIAIFISRMKVIIMCGRFTRRTATPVLMPATFA